MHVRQSIDYDQKDVRLRDNAISAKHTDAAEDSHRAGNFAWSAEFRDEPRDAADLAKLQIPYPQAIVETTDRLIREEPQLVKNYLKGLIAGIQYGISNPEPTKAILDKYVKINNPEFLAATYQDYVHITDRKAYPNIDGIRLALEEVAKRSPGAKGRKPEEFVNLRFLQELEKEGFYKELYGR